MWTSVPPRLGTQNQPHRGTLAPRYPRSSTPSPTRSSGPEFLGISDPRISWPLSITAPLLLCPSGRMFPWPNDRANQSSWGPRFRRTREPWHHGASASRAISIAAPRSPSPTGPVLPRSKAPWPAGPVETTGQAIQRTREPRSPVPGALRDQTPTRSSGPEFLGISDPRISWPLSIAAPLLLCPSGRMFPWPNDRANQSSWGPRFRRTREPWHHGASASRAISIAAPRSPSPTGPVLPRSKAPWPAGPVEPRVKRSNAPGSPGALSQGHSGIKVPKILPASAPPHRGS